MNPEHKKAVDEFIDKYIELLKAQLELYGTIPPEVYFFFKYNTAEKPFGYVALPHAKEFFISPEHKKYLKQHIQDCYTAIEKVVLPNTGNFKAELIAVILISDMYIYNVVHDPAEDVKEFMNTAIPPSEHPVSHEVIGFNIYFQNDSFTYHYPYTRKNKKIIFAADRTDTGSLLAGTFENLFPKKIQWHSI